MNSYFKYRDIIQTCDPRVWSSIKKSRESSQTPSLYWKSLLWFGKGKSSEIQLIQLPSPYSPHHHTTGWGIKFAAQQFEFNTLLTIYQSLLLSSLSSWAKEWQRARILSIASMLTDLWNLACFAAYRGHSFWAFKEDLVTQTEFVLFSTSGTKQERSWWRHCHLSGWTGTQVPVPLSTYDHQASLPCLAFL